MEFVIPVPIPKNWEWNLSFPFPFPKVGNAIFHSRSRSQNLGMQFDIPVPVTGNGLSKSGIRMGMEFKRWEKRGLLIDEIHLLNPLTFLDLHIIQFATSNMTSLASGHIMVDETHTPKLS